MPNFDKIASRVTAVGLLSFGVQDVRASLFGLTKPQVLLFGTQEGDLARGWDVLTSLQVEMHARCSTVESCNEEDQAENLQQIAKGFLRFLSLTNDSVLRSTASDVPTTSANINPDKWTNMSIYNKFDAWYQAAHQHLENGTTSGDEGPARIWDEFRPATPDEIAEFFELLKSQPEEGFIEKFMILYDQFLDEIFDRYYKIAKGLDGDDDPDTWNNFDEAEAQAVFTAHIFAEFDYDYLAVLA